MAGVRPRYDGFDTAVIRSPGFHESNWNGPVPTGAVTLPSSSYELSAMMLVGARVRCAGSGANGVLVPISTTRSPPPETDSTGRLANESDSKLRRREATTASTVSGVPSWNETPSLRVNFHVRLSSLVVHSEANPGLTDASYPAVVSGSMTFSFRNIHPLTSGSRESGFHGVPTRNVVSRSVCSEEEVRSPSCEMPLQPASPMRPAVAPFNASRRLSLRFRSVSILRGPRFSAGRSKARFDLRAMR